MARTRKFQTKAKTIDGQAQLRQRFVEVGKSLLKESPDGEPSLRKVAEVTGYSPSALYRYFGTKADLMYAIREDFLDRLVVYAKARIEGELNATHRLRLGFEAMVQFWVEHVDDFRHVYSYRVREANDPAIKSILPDQSPIRASRYFSSGLVREFFQQHDIEPSDELIDQLTDTLVVATHGVVAIPLGSPSMSYCPSQVMASTTVQAFIGSWTGFIDFLKAHRLTRQPTAKQYLQYIDTVARLS